MARLIEYSVDILLGSLKHTEKSTSHKHRLFYDIALNVLIKVEQILTIPWQVLKL